jgi:hypothetical protein
MPICPNGHQSGSDDWCEVCGHRMAGPGATAGAVPQPAPQRSGYGYGYPGPSDPNATAQAELCPQCRTPREALAPFCEECRYNFLTQTATSYTPIAPPPQPGPNLPPGFTGHGGGGTGHTGHTGPPQHTGHTGQQGHPGRTGHPGPPPGPPGVPGVPSVPEQDAYHGSRPSQVNRPAEPLREGPPQRPGYGYPPPAQQNQQPFPGDPRGSRAAAAPAPPYQQQPGPPAAPPHRPPSTGGDDWMLSPPSPTQSAGVPQGPGGHAGYQQPPQQPAYPQHGTGHHPGQQQHHDGGYQRQGVWSAVIGPDRAYFTAMMQRSGPDAEGLSLPAYSPEQHLQLTGGQITIGRRRVTTGESPDIDLSKPPEDPGVSHQHAMLVQQPDGSWAVVDQNSTNGTTLNGAEEPIQPFVPVPLNDGDRVHVGAWTTITIRRG